MILAQPVTGTTGNVLVGPGSVLKTSMGARLQGWGIPVIWIESDEAESSSSNNAENLANSTEQIDKLFQGRLVNSAMRTIYSAIVKYKGVTHVEP